MTTTPSTESKELYGDATRSAGVATSRGVGSGPEIPSDPVRGTIYRNIDRITPDGQVAREYAGNGIMVVREHIPSTGQLGRVRAIDAAGAVVQDLAYEYSDPYGNLTRRENRLAGASEAFTYDALQRLDRATRTWDDDRAALVIDYAYDALGNLVRKDDFAVDYQYGDAGRGNPAHAGPHAVLALTRPDGTVERDFAYDANGNMLAGNGRELRYSAANKPVEIRERGVTTHFAYGPDHARIKQTRGDETTYYIGPDYEYIVADGEVRERTYIGSHVVITQPVTAQPGTNGQQGQGVDPAARGPATEQKPRSDHEAFLDDAFDKIRGGREPIRFDLDRVHDALDIGSIAAEVSMLGAPIGMALDSANAVLSLVRGDWEGAALSLGAAVPGAGNAANAARLGRSAAKAADKAHDASKAVGGSAGSSRAGKPFTRKGKAEIDANNAKRHGGVNVCENCGTKVVPGQKSQRDVRPPGNERQRDHITPKSKGGTGDPSNGQILCRDCNLDKSDKL